MAAPGPAMGLHARAMAACALAMATPGPAAARTTPHHRVRPAHRQWGPIPSARAEWCYRLAGNTGVQISPAAGRGGRRSGLADAATLDDRFRKEASCGS